MNGKQFLETSSTATGTQLTSLILLILYSTYVIYAITRAKTFMLKDEVSVENHWGPWLVEVTKMKNTPENAKVIEAF